jgi:hypothetical protein
MVGLRTVETRVLHGLLTGILHNNAYSYLRTTKQLGYIVSAGISPMSNVDYVSVVVQGDAMKADKVEAQIEYVYSVLMPKELADMTDTQFQAHVASLKQKLTLPPTKYNEEFDHFWGPLAQGEESAACLNLQNEMLAYLATVTSKDALVNEWNRIANPSDPRTKIVVKHFAKEVPKRPTLVEAQAIWKDANIPDAYIERLTKEYNAATEYNKADSTTRADVLKNGGTFYPTTVNCQLQAAASAPSDKPDKTPSLLENSPNRHQSGHHTFLGSD